MPYVHPPVHPGVLTILPGTARIPAETAARAHTEALRVFYEVRGDEQALIQQIAVSAIDQQYLICSLRNRTTGQFTGNVLQILQYLQQTYGRISPGQLGDFESQVVTMTYDPCTPVDNVFNKVEDMMEYGEHSLEDRKVQGKHLCLEPSTPRPDCSQLDQLQGPFP